MNGRDFAAHIAELEAEIAYLRAENPRASAATHRIVMHRDVLEAMHRYTFPMGWAMSAIVAPRGALCWGPDAADAIEGWFRNDAAPKDWALLGFAVRYVPRDLPGSGLHLERYAPDPVTRDDFTIVGAPAWPPGEPG